MKRLSSNRCKTQLCNRERTLHRNGLRRIGDRLILRTWPKSGGLDAQCVNARKHKVKPCVARTFSKRPQLVTAVSNPPKDTLNTNDPFWWLHDFLTAMGHR